MAGPQSPFSVLGLRADATRAELDEAYRRLMKTHHPDLPGGDFNTAAEINRAYNLLKDKVPADPLPVPAVLAERPCARRRVRRRGQLAGAAMVVAAGAALLLVPTPLTPGVEKAVRPVSVTPKQSRELPAAALANPLALETLPNEDAVVTAVTQAARLKRDGLSGDAVSQSRSCESDLQTYPSLALLDHCVAFDAASGLLGESTSNPRFQNSLMASRHLTAAMRLSDDPVSAEERISRVRQMVQRLLIRRALEPSDGTGGAIKQVADAEESPVQETSDGSIAEVAP